MIYVLARARVRPGCMPLALDCYRQLVPQVLAAEPGCLAYEPTADLDQGLANQEHAPDEILVVEQWRSLDDFHRHLQMPHCLAFRQQIKPYLSAGITVRILQGRLLPCHFPEESHASG
ncbi:putative quinol monooxygenase [Propionivibrio dicarboxylicus]|uniref:Quinol monooxygenase YgiN n=1 Tax=Propionivibrio dicarboxylicus TaxID=83767 RepID=A0A1G8KM47_9RHOO|nr:putative quinol monooxygenase [Propionivibrio dicarboxylicus]SDI44503.1 Quinol monooxygenase YgiN [Propionivibrio dicarboxylicus]